MSVDFSNVKVGDRIKLTRENGDESTITVEAEGDQQDGSLVFDVFDTGYLALEWDTLEILEKPLPTKENAMIGHPTNSEYYPYVLRGGKWYHPGYDKVRSEEEVRRFLGEGFEVLYEGIPTDA